MITVVVHALSATTGNYSYCYQARSCPCVSLPICYTRRRFCRKHPSSFASELVSGIPVSFSGNILKVICSNGAATTWSAAGVITRMMLVAVAVVVVAAVVVPSVLLAGRSSTDGRDNTSTAPNIPPTNFSQR